MKNNPTLKVLIIVGICVATMVIIATPVAIGIYALAKGASLTVPTEAECKQLASDSLVELNEAVVTRDFSNLYQSISPLWQEQTSPEGLGEILAAFTDNDTNVNNAMGIEPEFETDPHLNGKALVMNGVFPSKPLRVVFKFEYMKDGDDWKMTAFNIKKKSYSLPMPIAEDSITLTEGIMKDFRDAIAKEDFSDFRSKISSSMQEAVSTEQFNEAFSGFFDPEINIDPVDSHTITKEPSLDEYGFMQMQTTYRSETFNVVSDYSWSVEDDQWKLMSINVNAQPIE